ncbi:MAG TPA: SMR family transporter, partial [Candidatus Kapabacteria bacterium]|nr:SMR family transporter [Candidatus Kapabacteria bacterium]
MHWFYLLLAGIFEIGWPVGFKLSQITSYRYLWIAFSVVSMGLSGYFL